MLKLGSSLRINPGNHNGQSEGSGSSFLSVSLHNLGNLLSHEVNSGNLIVGQSKTLGLNSSVINQLPCIGTETCKSGQNVLVNKRDLMKSPVFLELLGSLLLDSKNDKTVPLYSNGTVALFNLPV